jgi:hypothetical protein
MTRLSFSLLGLALLFAALAIPATAEACSCAGRGKDDPRGKYYGSAIKHSAAAVHAKVTDLRIIDHDPDIGGDETAVYTLRIRQSFKRLNQFPEGREIEVRSSTQGSACGLGLKEGATPGLLLYRHEGRLHGTSCGTTSPRNLRAGYRWLQRRSRPLKGAIDPTTGRECRDQGPRIA